MQILIHGPPAAPPGRFLFLFFVLLICLFLFICFLLFIVMVLLLSLTIFLCCSFCFTPFIFVYYPHPFMNSETSDEIAILV